MTAQQQAGTPSNSSQDSPKPAFGNPANPIKVHTSQSHAARVDQNCAHTTGVKQYRMFKAEEPEEPILLYHAAIFLECQCLECVGELAD